MTRKLITVVGLVLVLSGAGAAFAFWAGTGTGAAGATVGTMSAPSVSTSGGVGAVAIAWTAASPSAAGHGSEVTYFVERSRDGGPFSAATGTCAGTKTAATLGCDDHITTSGSFVYRVIATFRSWTSAGSSAGVTAAPLDAPTITAKPADPSADAAPSFTFSAASAQGYECKLDADPYAACTSPKAYSGLLDGSHTFSVRGLRSGLAGPVASSTWTIDRTAPVLGARPSDPTTSTSASVAFTHPSHTAFECRYDAAAFASCTSPATTSGLAAGPHTFDVRAIDAQGVRGQTASHSWTVSAAASPPVNESAPAISGTPAYGATLTASTGSWSNTPTSYTYRWARCKVRTCAFVGAASASSSYAVTSADADSVLAVTVTATNAHGSGEAVVRTAPVLRSTTATANLAVSGGTVRAIARMDDGSTVLGGTFTGIGLGGRAFTVDAAGTGYTGAIQADGAITAAAPDGSGGWYLGGVFTTVGGVTATRLVHVGSAGARLGDWTPSITGGAATVSSIVRDATSGKVYVGGEFTTANGSPRANLAVFGADGTLAAANPAPNGAVKAMTLSGGVLYAGGTFGQFAGQTRARLAALTVANDTVTTWAPSVTGTSVNALAVSGTIVYVGGVFTQLNGTARNNAGEVNTGSGTTTGSFNPDLNGAVNALAVASSGRVAVGGAFTQAGASARPALQVFNTNGSLPTGANQFNAAMASGATVTTLTRSGTTLYAGGSFTTLGGAARTNVGALPEAQNAATTTAAAWAPVIAGVPATLQVTGSAFFVAGDLSSAGTVGRQRLARITAAGAIDAWSPAFTGSTVNALAASGTTLYVGGAFTNVGGQSRANAAAFSGFASTTPTAWNPGVTGTVNAVASSGASTVVLGGTFSEGNGLVRVDNGTRSATWTPAAAGTTVNALAVSGPDVYVGGAFSSLGGQPRANAGAVTLAGTGTAAAWNPGTNGTVNALDIDDDLVYLGGAFSTLGGQPRGNAGAVQTDGTLWPYNPGSPVAITALRASGGHVYLAGAFGGRTMVATEAATGASRTWFPLHTNLTSEAVGAIYAAPGAPMAIGAAGPVNLVP